MPNITATANPRKTAAGYIRFTCISILLLCSPAYGQILGPILFGAPATAATCGAATGYSNFGTVTWSTEATLSGNLTNEVSTFLGDSHLKTVANGGLSQSSGTDIGFCTANDGTGTIISYYLVPGTYDPTTGLGEWKILAPSISHTTTTKIYIFVGKASASDTSCGPSGTANCSTTLCTNHLRIYPAGSASSLSIVDACANDSSPINHGVTATSGQINGGYSFAGSQTMDSGTTLPALTAFSGGYWYNSNTNGSESGWGNDDASDNGGILSYFTTNNSPCVSGGECIGVGYRQDASNVFIKYTSADVHLSGWVYILGSHAAGSANMTLYRNGAVDTGSIVQAGTATAPHTSTAHFQLGRNGDNTGLLNFTGTLDEVWIMKIAATADEAKWYFLNQNNASGTYSVTFP